MLDPVKKNSNSQASVLVSSLIHARAETPETPASRGFYTPGDARLVSMFGPMVRRDIPHLHENRLINARIQASEGYQNVNDTNTSYGRTPAPETRTPLHNLQHEERLMNKHSRTRLGATSGPDHFASKRRQSSLTVFQLPATDEDADYRRALDEALAAQPQPRFDLGLRATKLDDREVRLLLSMRREVGEPMNSIFLDEYRRRGYTYNRE